MDDFESSDIVVYTSEGYPIGSEIQHTIQLVPSISEIKPEKGNSGGTWITVYGTGFGTQTFGLNLVDSSNGNVLC